MHDDPFAGLESTLDAGLESTLEQSETMNGKFTDAVAARQFLRAGKATITLRSMKSGTRFTYRINAAPDGEVHFVGLLSGPDNYADYSYIGIIRRDLFVRTNKSRVSADAPSFRAFAFAWRGLAQGIIPAALEVWHEGRCGRCGRKLTVPESVASGFGPECIGKIQE